MRKRHKITSAHKWKWKNSDKSAFAKKSLDINTTQQLKECLEAGGLIVNNSPKTIRPLCLTKRVSVYFTIPHYCSGSSGEGLAVICLSTFFVTKRTATIKNDVVRIG
jgi:hypothetical protein